MTLLRSATTLCDIELDRPASEPFYRQLSKDLREAILSGRLPENIDD